MMPCLQCAMSRWCLCWCWSPLSHLRYSHCSHQPQPHSSSIPPPTRIGMFLFTTVHQCCNSHILTNFPDLGNLKSQGALHSSVAHSGPSVCRMQVSKWTQDVWLPGGWGAGEVSLTVPSYHDQCRWCGAEQLHAVLARGVGTKKVTTSCTHSAQPQYCLLTAHCHPWPPSDQQLRAEVIPTSS